MPLEPVSAQVPEAGFANVRVVSWCAVNTCLYYRDFKGVTWRGFGSKAPGNGCKYSPCRRFLPCAGGETNQSVQTSPTTHSRGHASCDTQRHQIHTCEGTSSSSMPLSFVSNDTPRPAPAQAVLTVQACSMNALLGPTVAASKDEPLIENGNHIISLNNRCIQLRTYSGTWLCALQAPHAFEDTDHANK